MSMKKVRTLTALAVTTALLSATTLSVFAEEPAAGGALESYGTITYEASEDPTDPMDPNDPGTIVDPDDGEDPTAGPLSIDFVSNFRFGTQEITSVDKTYNAAPQILWKLDEAGDRIAEEDGGKLVRPNYVQVTDNRGTEAGWELTVQQTTKFAATDDSAKTLEGTEISIPTVGYDTVSEDSEIAAAGIAASITLGYGEAAEKVMTAAKDEGAGTHIAKLGDLTGEEGEEMSTVTLTVPGSITKYATEYETEITWTLTAAPANEGPVEP